MRKRLGKPYILAIDQSTALTKGLLFDEVGALAARVDLAHRQIVEKEGWVEHDPMEIYENTVRVARGVLEHAGVQPQQVLCAAISNQRETAMVWDGRTGLPAYNAIVWQCPRGEEICKRIASGSEHGHGNDGNGARIKAITGLKLSPYFSAAKIAWVLENASSLPPKRRIRCGTIDSWLVFKLCGEQLTDYSNASRTQLFDIHALRWSDEVCSMFGIDAGALPDLRSSDTCFGESTFENVFPEAIPVHAVMGDSHAALFGQRCTQPGMVKATYGTGSSIMLHTGISAVTSDTLSTSLAWRIQGGVDYVLEGNINYAGAAMDWLVKDLGLIASAKQASELAMQSKGVPGLYFVPAFSGLGAPYWDADARALFCGIDRSCGKADLVRAVDESIAYQVSDIVQQMRIESGLEIRELRVDGGATRDAFLMQFQSDITDLAIQVSDVEELSGMGAAYAAGIAIGLYDAESLNAREYASYEPRMDAGQRMALQQGWRAAVSLAMTRR